MSTEQTTSPDVTITDNLDDFASSFFGENNEPSGDAKPEAVDVDADDSDDANNEEVDTQSDDQTGENDTPAPDDDSDDETETKDEADKPKPEKKNRLQERINELTAARREAERKLAEAEAKLAEKQTPKTDDPVKADTNTPQEGPKANDKNEDGTDKYPLGEFDPKFVKDTIQHVLAEERKATEAQKAEQEKLSAEDQYRATLQNSWNEKLEDVRERYPDYEDKGQEMLSVFEDIEPSCGQYLVDTLMELDAGPEVFYYLANNLDEAEEIVNAGPRKATIAFAKLEAQLAGTKTKEPVAKKVTNAPTPPPQVKGSAVSKSSVPADTDDLDAFSKQLFKKR